jgi:hypothetical protein
MRAGEKVGDADLMERGNYAQILGIPLPGLGLR